jgi:hypothetical protein
MNPILSGSIILLLAILISHYLGAVIVRWSVRDYEEELDDLNAGLPNAGKLIGRLERLLILIFVTSGNLTGVGFLLTAKSVFRFGDIKDDNTQKRTEYYLIGSLASFTVAIVLGYAARFAMKMI